MPDNRALDAAITRLVRCSYVFAGAMAAIIHDERVKELYPLAHAALEEALREHTEAAQARREALK